MFPFLLRLMSPPAGLFQMTLGTGNPSALHMRVALLPSATDTSADDSSSTMRGGMTTSRWATFNKIDKSQVFFEISRFIFLRKVHCPLSPWRGQFYYQRLHLWNLNRVFKTISVNSVPLSFLVSLFNVEEDGFLYIRLVG